MVVQKFGGTSVADPEAIRRLIEIVRTARTMDGRGPVVVVSAMSKVTDALLAVASMAGAGRTGEALQRVDELRERHASIVRALVTGPAQAPLLAHIAGQFDQLADIVRALTILREETREGKLDPEVLRIFLEAKIYDRDDFKALLQPKT